MFLPVPSLTAYMRQKTTSLVLFFSASSLNVLDVDRVTAEPFYIRLLRERVQRVVERAAGPMASRLPVPWPRSRLCRGRGLIGDVTRSPLDAVALQSPIWPRHSLDRPGMRTDHVAASLKNYPSFILSLYRYCFLSNHESFN